MHLIDLPATWLGNYTLGRRKSCNKISGRERYQLLAAARALLCMIRRRGPALILFWRCHLEPRAQEDASSSHDYVCTPPPGHLISAISHSLTHSLGVQSERAICAHCARSGNVTLTHRHLDLAQTL